MAIAVIGGLVVSTALSLIFVPAAFTLLDDAGQVAWRLFARVLNDDRDVDHGTDALAKPFD
jgi:HAE1 family hydrophobic/amphiphilic exporter-1